jgi:hypothetical protein
MSRTSDQNTGSEIPADRRATGPTNRRELSNSVEDARTAQQKGWFSEYIYSQERPVLGTLWKWLTFKPVEGLLGGGTVGKIGRAAAIAAALYFGTPYLFNAFGAAEGASTGTGLNWFSRFGKATQRLASPGIVGGDAGSAFESYGGTMGGV